MRNNKIDKYFATLNNNVYSDEYGDVSLSKTSRRSEIRHGNTKVKSASYAAIPNVIKLGKTVYVSKKSDVERIVVAAPVNIANERYYMGVMLQRDNSNQRLYLHDVITEKEDLSQVNHQLHESLATINVKSSNDNVSQNDTSVNSIDMRNKPKYSIKEDSEGNKLSVEQVKRYKNIAPELRDEQGRIKPFYHGTSRADRVGNYFNPDRATSGPMAYFTDDADIAENYSKDKADTSLAYEEEYDSYETQFRVNGEPIINYWNRLSSNEKRELTKKFNKLL